MNEPRGSDGDAPWTEEDRYRLDLAVGAALEHVFTGKRPHIPRCSGCAFWPSAGGVTLGGRTARVCQWNGDAQFDDSPACTAHQPVQPEDRTR